METAGDTVTALAVVTSKFISCIIYIYIYNEAKKYKANKKKLNYVSTILINEEVNIFIEVNKV